MNHELCLYQWLSKGRGNARKRYEREGMRRMTQEQTTIRFAAELKEQTQREADGKGKIPEGSFAGFWEKYPIKTIG